jgi:TIR domain
MSEEIFVSYRRSDSAAFAGRIRDRLDALFPRSVFLDIDNIKPGADFIERIENVIRSSKVAVILIGKDWLESSQGGTRIGDEKDFVTLEVREALANKIPVLPVLVDGASMPRDKLLPESIKDMTRQNAVEIRHSHFEKDFESLASAIYEFLALKPPTRFEQLMESLVCRLGWSNFRFDEAARSWHALVALVLGILSVLETGFVVMGGFDPDLEFMFSTAVSVYPAIIGMNSATKRPLALIGLGLCAVSFLLQFVAWEAKGLAVLD